MIREIKTCAVIAIAIAFTACGGHGAAPESAPNGPDTMRMAPPDSTRRPPRPEFDAKRPWAHDPVIAIEGDTVYAFTTGHGIHQLRSLDLETWEFDGPCIEELPEWVKERNPTASLHLWAPDIIYHGGLWHLFYCSSNFATNKSVIGHLTNETLNRRSAAYKWEDKGLVLQSVPNRDFWNAIDPNIAICADGSAWMDFGSFWGGIKMVRLSDDLSQIADPQEWHTISARPKMINPDDTSEKPGEGAVEAPFIFKHDGWFYLFVSFDYCCRGEESTYHVVCGRSKDIRGPYVDKSGERMDLGGGTRVDLPAADNERYVAYGHCAMATLRGQDYMALHAYKRTDGQSELILRKVEWGDTGWPTLRGE